MSNDELIVYIKQRLADLQKEKDMTEVVYKGQLSFGINSKEYQHLPSWKTL